MRPSVDFIRNWIVSYRPLNTARCLLGIIFEKPLKELVSHC